MAKRVLLCPPTYFDVVDQKNPYMSGESPVDHAKARSQWQTLRSALEQSGCEVETIGIRPGEKLHEVLVSEDEARNTLELPDMYVVQPAHAWWRRENWEGGRPLAEGFRYTSDNNSRWLTNRELQDLIAPIAPAEPSDAVLARPA